MEDGGFAGARQKKFQKRFDGKAKSCEVTCGRRPRRAAGVIQDAVPVEWRVIFDIVKQALGARVTA